MKKNSLVKKLVLATVGIGILFFGGSYLSQHFIEKQMVAQAKEEQGESEEDIAKAIEESKVMFEKMDNMTVKEYYESTWDSGKEIVAEFQEMYDESAANIKQKDLTDEQRDDLRALYHLHEYGENEILTKNEVNVTYAEEQSLESSTAEVMAIRPDIGTETIVTKICEDAGIDPNGKIKDLTVAVIVEIEHQIFEYEQESHGNSEE